MFFKEMCPNMKGPVFSRRHRTRRIISGFTGGPSESELALVE